MNFVGYPRKRLGTLVCRCCFLVGMVLLSMVSPARLILKKHNGGYSGATSDHGGSVGGGRSSESEMLSIAYFDLVPPQSLYRSGSGHHRLMGQWKQAHLEASGTAGDSDTWYMFRKSTFVVISLLPHTVTPQRMCSSVS
ncbi:hypothetical protein B0H10DRAFT_918478 [Mycena sp. CBHHK59/15]|nr:hypothetical protein B0H10DRAFT_564310 [Mycena sp. CBHHK59/15]KAJ6622255.1 hypothetical protein B0H10DRAFT_918478 [Mycena sp. CBHHK59/15]